DRGAIAQAVERLRFTAADVWVNEGAAGPGAGLLPLGGPRAAATAGLAGAVQHLLPWTSARSIAETFRPPAGDVRPHPG
ncbi:1-pyrroline-5-carboxylate dehydrogenase, partial [Kitasatospora sp. NPDC059571]